MRLVKAVLFDLDGTLVDSLPELYHGVHTVLSDMGLKAPSQEAVGAMIGRGILVLVQRLCAALGIAVETEQGRDLFDRLLKAWSESGGRHMAFYPGVIEGVEQLKDKGIRVALVTNKQRSLTVEFLQSRGLESLFDTVVAGDDCPNNKPAPDMLIRAMTEMNVCASETVMVGDSPERCCWRAVRPGFRWLWLRRIQRGRKHCRLGPRGGIHPRLSERKKGVRAGSWPQADCNLLKARILIDPRG